MRGIIAAGLAVGALFAGTVAHAQTSDLSLSMDVDNATPAIDDTITFTITLTNGGPDTTIELGIEHVLPAELSFVSATPSEGNYDAMNHQWFLVSIANGASATLDVQAQVLQAGAGGAALVHTAEVFFADLPDPDSTPGNGDDTEDDWAEASVTVDTSGGNQPPVASDGEVTIPPPPIDSADVFLEASDPDGDALTFVVDDPGDIYNSVEVYYEGPEPNHFTVESQASGGPFTFTFYADDGMAQSNVATVTVYHRANDPPKDSLCFATIVPTDGPRKHAIGLGLLALGFLVGISRRRPPR